MGRPIMATLLVFAMLGIVVTPAHAKDRKSGSARDRETFSDMLAARHERSVVMRQEAAGAEMSAGRNGKPIAPLAEEPAVGSNPFRFNIGTVAVQPTVGGIKGAKFSIGF